MVILVRHDDPVLGVTANTCRTIKLPVLLAPDPKLVMKDSFGSEHLDAVVGPVGDQEVAFARTTNSPRSTKFSVFLSFNAESEEGSADVVVAATWGAMLSIHCANI